MQLTKPCLVCHKTIIKRQNRSLTAWNERTKFCSRKCREVWMKTKMLGNKSSLGVKHTEDWKHMMSKPFSGDKHPQWKGDLVGYNGVHRWLNKTYGTPTYCENLKCVYPRQGAKKWLEKPYKFEWALLKGKKYSRDRKDYMWLCTACHRKYDSN